MDFDTAKSAISVALTQASLGNHPPDLSAAIGHDDDVMLLLLRVPDADATTQILMESIILSEINSIVQSLAITPGLILKRFDVDDALRLKAHLEAVGTEVELVRPNQ